MKVLMISANTEQINMPVLPIGLACVAEAVQRAGHEVKLVNPGAASPSRSAFAGAIGGKKTAANGAECNGMAGGLLRWGRRCSGTASLRRRGDEGRL